MGSDIIACPYCGDYKELEEGYPLQVGGGQETNFEVECPHCGKTYVVMYYIDFDTRTKEEE